MTLIDLWLCQVNVISIEPFLQLSRRVQYIYLFCPLWLVIRMDQDNATCSEDYLMWWINSWHQWILLLGDSSKSTSKSTSLGPLLRPQPPISVPDEASVDNHKEETWARSGHISWAYQASGVHVQYCVMGKATIMFYNFLHLLLQLHLQNHPFPI